MELQAIENELLRQLEAQEREINGTHVGQMEDDRASLLAALKKTAQLSNEMKTELEAAMKTIENLSAEKMDLLNQLTAAKNNTGGFIDKAMKLELNLHEATQKLGCAQEGLRAMQVKGAGSDRIIEHLEGLLKFAINGHDIGEE